MGPTNINSHAMVHGDLNEVIQFHLRWPFPPTSVVTSILRVAKYEITPNKYTVHNLFRNSGFTKVADMSGCINTSAIPTPDQSLLAAGVFKFFHRKYSTSCI